MKMKAIVCVDNNWGIGKDGSLLLRIPDDMKRFRAMTLGKTVVCGRNTVATFPNGKPLKGRENLILSDRNEPGTIGSIDELMSVISDKDEVFVIGGAMTYRELLPYCDGVYVTRVDAAFEADAWFPNLDEMPEWRKMERGEPRQYNGITYWYELYGRL